MTVTEAVKLSGLTPSAAYTGVETTDDFLLAVQTEASQTDVKNWGGLCRPRAGAQRRTERLHHGQHLHPHRPCHHQGQCPAHPLHSGRPLCGRRLSGLPALPQDRVRLRPERGGALCLLLSPHRQGREGRRRAHPDQRCGRQRPARMPPLPPISRASAPRLSSTITPPSRAERKEHR